MALLANLKQCWHNRATIGDVHQQRELAQFQPESLEIQQTPPHPLPGYLGWSIISLLFIAIVWACVGNIDIVASAEGKIVPSARVKQIQPLDKGVVTQLMVAEGDYVNQGQALVVLDPTVTQADESRLASQLQNLRAQLTIAKKLHQQISQPTEVSTFVQHVEFVSAIPYTKQQLGYYRHWLKQQWLEYDTGLKVLQSTLKKVKAQGNVSRQMVTKLKLTLPLVTQRVDILQQLVAQSFSSQQEWLLAEQERIQQAQDLAAENYRLAELVASQGEIEQQINAYTANYQSQLLEKVTQLTQQVHAVTQEWQKAKNRNAKQILYAPVAGRVQELAINTVGGVVTAAQQLMIIVPKDQQLIVEVFLQNKDIGFVKEGMDAEIKIHTFPFTKYGVIPATVKTVAQDATLDEKQGLIYRIQLVLSKNTLQVEHRSVRLQPGMGVTAEIKTSQRRIIEYFLTPIRRATQESIRER